MDTHTKTVSIVPENVRNAGENILSLADILSRDDFLNGHRIERTYEQSYWYALGRMDGETNGHADHAEADLFGRARATAHHRMLFGETVSTGSMMEDYENARNFRQNYYFPDYYRH